MTRKTMMLAALLMVAACGSTERRGHQAETTGVAYDTVKDARTAGLYQAQGVYDVSEANKGKVVPDEVRWRTLYNGLQVVQKAGYDSATVAGPAAMTSNRTVSRGGMVVSTADWPGFVYVIHGYRQGETIPPAAKPITRLMDEANRRAHAAAGPVTAKK